MFHDDEKHLKVSGTKEQLYNSLLKQILADQDAKQSLAKRKKMDEYESDSDYD